jgi:hypothetical protein
MTSINPIVKQALAGCSAPAFFHAWRATSAYPTLPTTYITYQETLFQPEQFADDAPTANGRYVRVSVWSDGSTAALADQVYEGMFGEGFVLSGAQDIYESDTQTYHWASDWYLDQSADE